MGLNLLQVNLEEIHGHFRTSIRLNGRAITFVSSASKWVEGNTQNFDHLLQVDFAEVRTQFKGLERVSTSS